MINSFSQYLVEEERTVYFTFGRMNPPTIGHGKLLDKVASAAVRNPYRIFLSQSSDAKDNPLAYADKIKHVRKMFPKHARQVMISKKVITPFHALSALYDEGFRKVVMVAGSDRLQEYDTRLNMYNGKKGKHGFYNFEGGVEIVSAGQRDPDAKGAEGASGTKQREYASSNNYPGFAQGLPKAMSNSDARKLFNDVRKGLGLKEETSFKNHISLKSVSERRESFVAGQLFDLGDSVVVKESDEVCTIAVMGANYVIVEMSDGRRLRKWLDSIEKVEEAYEIGTPEYNKHVRSMTPGQKVEKTLTPAEKKKREEIAKAIERDNPNMDKSKKMAIATATAKRVAEDEKKGLWHNIHKKRKEGRPMRKPGSKGAPTAQDFKNAAEATDHMATAKATIAKDKEQSRNMIAKEREKDKVKHDRILDKARRARMLAKNKGTNTQ